ncbi:MAG: gfo/Idh/MocA family oxidoreductase, partial [bacterium]|nr:gfo/Idh/MocA family oxidoreductase [bacterium]
DALIEAQKKNPKVVGQIGFQRRATKIYAEGIKRARQGDFGTLIDGRAAWNNSWGPIGRPEDGRRIWLGRRAKSGDWMLEQACHSWDVLCWLAGKMPIAASGIGRRDCFKDMDPERDVTDYYIAHLQFANGLSVDFEHSWLCPKDDKGRFSGVFERVAGTKGGIDFGSGELFWRPGQKGPANLGIN